MRPVLSLLPSPLLGPACWRPVATALRGDGWDVAEVTSPAPAAGLAGPRTGSLAGPRTGAEALAEMLTAVPDDRDTVLVPHSNAGLFVASIAEARPRVIGYVFVDAGLPLPPGGEVPMIPGEFYEMLAGKADDEGMLPPWTQWWDTDISELFPNDMTRAEIEREQRRLPLSYFTESLTIPSGWADRGAAYLAFGDGYAGERATAERLDWPARTLPGEHLHMLMAPGEVAAAITELAAPLASARD